MSFTSGRDLYTVALGRAVSTLGNEVALIALMLRVHDSGDGSWAIAGLLAAGTLPLVLFAPLAGSLVDRYDSRLLIVASSLIQALFTGVLAFTHSLPALLALVAATGAGSAVANPTFSALVPQLAPGELLARANSLLQGSNVVAMLAGPAVGGLLVGLTGGAEVPLLVDAGTFLAITAAGLVIRTRRRPERHATPPRWREGLSAVTGDSVLVAVYTLLVLFVIAGEMVNIADVFLARDTFGASAFTYGAMSVVFSAGMLAGSVLAGRIGAPRRIVAAIPLSAAVMAAAIALIGLSPALAGLPMAFCCLLVLGVGNGALNVHTPTLVALRTPAALLGRAMSTLAGLTRGAGMLAIGLGGVVTSLLSPPAVFTASGVACLLVVGATLPALRSARHAVAVAGDVPAAA
ncbi:MAG: MFS transporter [Mycobacteriales bacterium]